MESDSNQQLADRVIAKLVRLSTKPVELWTRREHEVVEAVREFMASRGIAKGPHVRGARGDDDGRA